MTGIVTRPGFTFTAVAERPRWGGLLAVLTLVSFAASAGFLATDVGRQALVDQWERTALAFGQTVDDARYAELQELSRYAVPYAALVTVARGPAAAFVIAGVLYGVFAVRGAQATFRQVMAVVVHAGVILAIRDVVAAPVDYLRESIASPVTLVSVFGVLDEASAAARFLALVDLFVLWWVTVLAIGTAILYRVRTRVVGFTFLTAYVGVALLLAGTMALLGGSV